MTRTIRNAEGTLGRLFPEKAWDNGWRLSIQADRSGYACSPQERLETLEEYETVEAALYGPFQGPVDVSTLGLPFDVAAKFTKPDSGVAVGASLTWDDVSEVTRAVMRAGLNRNIGVPRGRYGWQDRLIFHGTSLKFAHDIVENGPAIEKSSKGYFGQAFYAAEEEALARSNYADFADDDEAAVVRLQIVKADHILDLRNAQDFERWKASGLAEKIGVDDFARLARLNKIDGVFDNSVGGLAIYNPNILDYPVFVEDMRSQPVP